MDDQRTNRESGGGMRKSGKRGYPPKIKGNLEIHKGRNGIFIGGDPNGLRSLANLLHWLADVDQESDPNMPDGEREHTHMYSGSQLTSHSVDTEICRLDAKGTGEFPSYRKQSKRAEK
jgi:hypothetical protein